MAMKMMVFDVEHGACAFIKTPTNHTILIDCGCTEAFSPVLYIAKNELPGAAGWNGRQLTQMIVTHPHDDHITEVEAIKNNCPPAFLLRQTYEWEEVKIAENGDYDNLDTYTTWQATYNQPFAQYPDLGLKLQWFMLSAAEAKKVNGSKFINNSSIVVVVTVTGTQFQEKFLFGGDMETAGWEALLKNPNFKIAVKDVDFFVVSHHGHESGFSEALFVAMGRKPILNIVSIHHNDEHIDDRYRQEAYSIGTKVNGDDRRMLTTRCDGTITIEVDGEGRFAVNLSHLDENKLAKVRRYNFL